MTSTPLIEIKRVPIEIEMKISRAKLEYTRGTADLEISRGNNGLHIKSKAIQLNMDRFEPSNIVVPNTHHSFSNQVNQKSQTTYEATASYASQGQLLLKARLGQNLSEQLGIDVRNISQEPVFNAKQGENVLNNIDTTELNIKFEMDKLNFDWHLSNFDFEFTPGNIEISVTQQPDVIIKYIGGPIYVPPSSDPNYEPIDTMA